MLLRDEFLTPALIFSMLMSVDGSVEDEHGRFGWAAPDEEVHSYLL